MSAIVRRGDRWCVRSADTDHVTDAVIVTVPIGVLQSGTIEFDPPLPLPVRGALDRIGCGPVTKVFFSFDSAFWAPRRAFWIAADPPAVFELWVDVSAVRGAPTLCAFAVGDHAARVEQMTEDDLLATGWTALRSATWG